MKINITQTVIDRAIKRKKTINYSLIRDCLIGFIVRRRTQKDILCGASFLFDVDSGKRFILPKIVSQVIEEFMTSNPIITPFSFELPKFWESEYIQEPIPYNFSD